MYMPKSAIQVGVSSTNTLQSQNTGYMPKSAVPVGNNQQPQGNNQKSIGGFLGNLLGSAFNTAGGIGNVITHPVQTVENAGKLAFGEGETGMAHLMGTPNDVINQPQQMANQFNKNLADRYGSPQNAGNTLYNDPVGAAMDLSSVLDAGAGTVGKLGDISKLDSISNASDLLNKASQVSNPLNVVPAMGNGAGWVTSKVGQNIANIGETLPLRGLRPSPSQLTNFKTTTGEDLGAFLNRNNITGDFSNNAQNAIDDLQQKYDTLAKDSKTSVPLKDIASQYLPIVQKWQQSLNPALAAKAEDIKGYLTAMAHKYGMDNSFTPQDITAADGAINPEMFKGTMSINDVLNEKRELSDVLKSPQFNGLNPEQAMLNTNLYHGLKGAINDATAKTDPNGIGVGPIGKEEQKYIALKNIADRQGNLGRGSQPLSLTGAALTGGTTALGGILGNIFGSPQIGAILGLGAGPIISEIARNPKVISRESQALQGIGNATNAVGKGVRALNQSDKYAQFLNMLRNAGVMNQNQSYGNNQ